MISGRNQSWATRIAVCGLALAIVASGSRAVQHAAAPNAAETKSQPQADKVQKAGAKVKPATIQDLQWISGTWDTSMGKDELTEIWSAPSGNHIAGVFSWVKDGKLWMNELITIVDEGERMVFRLRHFDDQMVPWEEKDGAYTFPMVSAGPNEAVFESFDPRYSYRFTFKCPSPDKMVVTISSSDPVKTDPPRTFEFSRRQK